MGAVEGLSNKNGLNRRRDNSLLAEETLLKTFCSFFDISPCHLKMCSLFKDSKLISTFYASTPLISPGL